MHKRRESAVEKIKTAAKMFEAFEKSGVPYNFEKDIQSKLHMGHWSKNDLREIISGRITPEGVLERYASRQAKLKAERKDKEQRLRTLQKTLFDEQQQELPEETDDKKFSADNLITLEDAIDLVFSAMSKIVKRELIGGYDNA